MSVNEQDKPHEMMTNDDIQKGDSMRCSAKTLKGGQCKFEAEPGDDYCKIHIRQRDFTFDQEQNDKARAEFIAHNRRREKSQQEHKKAWDRAMKENNVFVLKELVRPYPPHEPWPESYYTMVCGAKTRAGTPCKRTDIYENGRCGFHGGLSTGPNTAAGKKKVTLNLPCVRKKQSP